MHAQIRRTRRHLTRCAILGGLFASMACGSSPTQPNPPNPPPATVTVTSVTVGGGTTITAGQTAQFTATANMSNSTQQNVSGTATWASSNNAIATVSGSGLATGVAAGSVEIRATSQGVTGTASLQVNAPAATPPVAQFTVRGPGGSTNVCRIIVNSNGDFDCTFDGSASTGGTGSTVAQWTWRYDVGQNSSPPVNRNTPTFQPSNLCNFLGQNDKPAEIGNTGTTQMIVKLVVRNAAGVESTETRNSNVTLIPQEQCGFGF